MAEPASIALLSAVALFTAFCLFSLAGCTSYVPPKQICADLEAQGFEVDCR